MPGCGLRGEEIAEEANALVGGDITAGLLLNLFLKHQQKQCECVLI